MKKKRAVVTGASSKTVALLIDKMLESDYSVTAVSRVKHENEPREGVTWVQCDLSAPDQDFSFLRDADLLIHAAAISYAYTLVEYLLNNYQSTVNLVEASKKFGVKKFVYISSILAGYGYGDYAVSKIKSEEYIRQELNSWLIIRPAQLYGYSKSNPVDKLINTIQEKSIVFSPIGDKKTISPLHYKELVRLIFLCVVKNEESNVIKVFSGPESFTYSGLVKEIMNTPSRKVVIVPIPKALIMSVFYLLKIFHLKIGVYPDQLFRFYHNPQNEVSPEKTITIAEYLRENM